MPPRLVLKVDVDTDRGTRLGVPNLVADLRAAGMPATFLFSLGPDQTGRAITRIFRPGFLQKISRTSVVEIYGWRTLLNGTLLPAPHIGRRNEAVMRATRDAGFEVGIHCYNHYHWQDHVHRLDAEAVRVEFEAARAEFRRIFGTEAVGAGAAGWQANERSRDAYDRAALLYASDTRGREPYFPAVDARTFTTLEIPTTLPTLDELMGRPEYPDDQLAPSLVALLRPGQVNVLTIHAEIEGMGRRAIFGQFLRLVAQQGVEVVTLEHVARECLARRQEIPVCPLGQESVPGRSGLVAAQGPRVAGNPGYCRSTL